MEGSAIDSGFPSRIDTSGNVGSPDIYYELLQTPSKNDSSFGKGKQKFPLGSFGWAKENACDRLDKGLCTQHVRGLGLRLLTVTNQILLAKLA